MPKTLSFSKERVILESHTELDDAYYNSLLSRQALRVRLLKGALMSWEEPTPAMAASLTDHA